MVNWGLVGTAAATNTLLSSSVLLIVMSGIGYQYFSSDLLIFRSSIGYHLLFGCGIGLSILIFIGIWGFMLVPRWKIHYFLTFPALWIQIFVYIWACSPSSCQQYIKDWSGQWLASSLVVQKLEIQYECCGWVNASDRGLLPCPSTFQSGCIQIVTDYLESRTEELLAAALAVLFTTLASAIALFVVAYKSPNTTVLSELHD
jgi:hypothetical protein